MSTSSDHSKAKKERTAQLDYLICRRFKKCRTAAGLSQQDVANSIGVSIQQIQKHENYVNRISSGKLLAIVQSFNVTLDHFFNLDREIEPQVAQIREEGEQFYISAEFNIEGVDKKEISSFIRAIYAIKDNRTRRKLLEFIKSM